MGRRDCENVKKQIIEAQRVYESNVKTLKVCNFFVDGKPFPPASISSSYKITGTTVIVGNSGACIGNCPAATPGTPQGGSFVLANSFTGKLTFCGVDGVTLDLAGLVISNSGDYAVEFINCSQVYVKNGSINCSDFPAVHVACSNNVGLKYINTSNSFAALLVDNNCSDLVVDHWYVENVSAYAFTFKNSHYLQVGNLNITNISGYTENALVYFTSSEMIFVEKISLYNINITNVSGTKSLLYLTQCFDIKISKTSILTTYFTTNQNLNLYMIYISSCGSVMLGSNIIDGNGLTLTGSSGTINCIRVDDSFGTGSNNIFAYYAVINDNYIEGDASSSVAFHAFHLEDTTTFRMNSYKVCTNYTLGDVLSSEIRAFYGIRGGNWYFDRHIFNSNYVSASSVIQNSSIYGLEIIDISSSIFLTTSTANNNGLDLINTSQSSSPFWTQEVGGYKIYGINPENNTQTNVNIEDCTANQNESNSVSGITIGFLSTYSNTSIENCEAISNISGENCYGFLLPGLVGTQQITVSVSKCTANTNFSENGEAYGIYVGKTDGNIIGAIGTTSGVQTMTISCCTFSANGPVDGSFPSNPGTGIYLSDVLVSAVRDCLLNQNNYGFYADLGSNNSLDNNSAAYNDQGFTFNNSPNSIIQSCLAQNNSNGYSDNTTPSISMVMNTYLRNKAVNNTVSSYELITPAVISWFKYLPASGTFTFVSGDPNLSSFSNLSITN